VASIQHPITIQKAVFTAFFYFREGIGGRLRNMRKERKEEILGNMQFVNPSGVK